MLTRSDEIYDESRRLAAELNGHYMDQFTYAERATDWRGNNNIANIFNQMQMEDHPVPAGCNEPRYWWYFSNDPVVSFVTNSMKLSFALSTLKTQYSTNTSKRVMLMLKATHSARLKALVVHVQASFIPGVVDEMRKIPDAASIATTHWLSDILGRKVGASTGTNMYGVLQLASEMKMRGEKGSIVTLLCDSGGRYPRHLLQ